MVETKVDFEKIKNVRETPLEEFYTSGHRTCQGCESALVMRDFAKAAGARTIATGATGCMYVANTSYQTTPWIIPWMHTQLGAGGASAVGMAAGLRALMRKGKIPKEKINVINFSGDLGGGDMGLSGISGALQTDLDLLIILYDNESAANTDIQATGLTTYGAQTTFTPPGSKRRIMHSRWKKNVAAMLAVGHPTCRYIATASATLTRSIPAGDSIPGRVIDDVFPALTTPTRPGAFSACSPPKSVHNFVFICVSPSCSRQSTLAGWLMSFRRRSICPVPFTWFTRIPVRVRLGVKAG